MEALYIETGEYNWKLARSAMVYKPSALQNLGLCKTWKEADRVHKIATEIMRNDGLGELWGCVIR